jgi:APA family basic amino acid/polyamine antiporter
MDYAAAAGDGNDGDGDESLGGGSGAAALHYRHRRSHRSHNHRPPLPDGGNGLNEYGEGDSDDTALSPPPSPLPPNAASTSSAHSATSSSIRQLERHLTFWDLLAMGVGGTVGSGLFVLAGMVAHAFAGPAAAVSWILSGVAALLSGSCYAELSSRIPQTGGAYAYATAAIGPLAGVLTASCLTLEYLAAASAVSRSWGDKVVEWLTFTLGEGHAAVQLLGGEGGGAGLTGSFSPLAFLISSGTVMLLLNGVHESKRATNLFTALKIALVLFMTILGFLHTNPANWTPFVPPPSSTTTTSTAVGGYSGVVRGATATFFGYLGYDQVSCLGGEAKNPRRNLPRAIVATIVGVAVVYVLATLALTGMQPYTDISPVSGFPSAFYALGLPWAGQIAALGEIVTLPIVVLISLMAQPRLQYALANDGFAPSILAQTDDGGNLWWGTLLAGSLMVIIASFVPFDKLNDAISCAVLAALSLTDTSLVLMWHSSSSFPSSSSSSPCTAPSRPWSDEGVDGLARVHHAFTAVMDDDEDDDHEGDNTGPSIKRSDRRFLSGTGLPRAAAPEMLMLAFHAGAFLSSVSLTLFSETIPGILAVIVGSCCMAMAVYGIVVYCPRAPAFGGVGGDRGFVDGDGKASRRIPADVGDGLVRTANARDGDSFSSLNDMPLPDTAAHDDNDDDDICNKNDDSQDGYFSVPTPYVPCLGILVNWYLIAQLDMAGIVGLLVFLGLAVLYYYAVLACSGRRWGGGGIVAPTGMRKRTPSEDA